MAISNFKMDLPTLNKVPLEKKRSLIVTGLS